MVLAISACVHYLLYRLIQPLGKKYFARYNNIWNGPVPTKVEQQANKEWITKYLQKYPGSDLARQYPDCATHAYLYRAYLQLEYSRDAGEIDDIDYEKELAKILPLIDISNVLKP